MNHLLFLDAVEFGGTPGSLVFLNTEQMAARSPQVSTHKISLCLLAKLAEERGTKAWLLGVQPGSLKYSKALTPAVQMTLDVLAELICDVWISWNYTGDMTMLPNISPPDLPLI